MHALVVYERPLEPALAVYGSTFPFLPYILCKQKSLFTNQRIKCLFIAMLYSWDVNHVAKKQFKPSAKTFNFKLALGYLSAALFWKLPPQSNANLSLGHIQPCIDVPWRTLTQPANPTIPKPKKQPKTKPTHSRKNSRSSSNRQRINLTSIIKNS